MSKAEERIRPFYAAVREVIRENQPYNIAPGPGGYYHQILHDLDVVGSLAEDQFPRPGIPKGWVAVPAQYSGFGALSHSASTPDRALLDFIAQHRASSQ